ncbi:MAG: lactonase family protein [Planctomycetota bacterium]|jgi:6-phosphogluconolactonase|nr:lactonase family protein [Planctomycetota bacterium]MDP7249752.1 lactonase family protein [Planctomycetota bacterium]
MSDTLVFVGSYSDAAQSGIHVYRLDSEKGAIEPISAIGGVKNPSFLAISPNKRNLYAVSEIGDFEGKPVGGVSGFSIDLEKGELQHINDQPCGGSGPCHLSVDQTGRYIVVANYGGGSVSMLPINEDGSLGEVSDFHQHEGSSVNEGRQKEPHAHSFFIDNSNRHALCSDLGIDKVMIYKLDLENGKLVPAGHAPIQPGAGPRHLDFHPNGKFIYVINELDNMMNVLNYNAETGETSDVEHVPTLPADFGGDSYTADVHISADGRFLYGSNRGHNSIVIYSVDADTGKITLVGHEPTQGDHPRNFCIDPSGQFLFAANQNNDNIVPFRIDQETGELNETGHITEVNKPVCVKMIVT